MRNGIRTERAAGVALVALSATCFGAMPVFARLIYSAGPDPGGLLLLRVASAERRAVGSTG